MPPADDLRLPSLDALRAFEAAARLGSFERAADELAVTASAIGKRVAALESLIGIELLQRGGKALALTATGRDYLAQVRPALTLLMAVPLHRRTAQRLEKLRVSAPPTFARQILVPALETVYPALTSQFTLIMLASSVVGTISANELSSMASLVDSETFRSFETYLIVTPIYIALAFLFRGTFALVAALVFRRRRRLDGFLGFGGAR